MLSWELVNKHHTGRVITCPTCIQYLLYLVSLLEPVPRVTIRGGTQPPLDGALTMLGGQLNFIILIL
jgi:hypothetical protein